MKAIFLCIVNLFLFSELLSQSSFELHIKRNYSQDAINIIESPSSNYFIVGGANDSIHTWNSFNGYFIKIDSHGVLLKDTVFSSPNNFLIYSKISINDTNNLIVYGVEKDSLGNKRIIFTKLDTNLNKLFSKYYFNNSYPKHQNIESFYKSNDTLTTICHGQTASGDDDYFICQFDTNYDSIKTVNFMYPGAQMGYDILKTINGYKLITFNTPDGSNQLGNDIVTLDNNFNETSVKELSDFPPKNPSATKPFYSNTAMKWINDTVYLASARVNNQEYLFQDSYKSQGIGVLFINKNDTILDSRIFGKADTSEMEAIKGMDFLYKEHIYVTGTSNYFQGPIPSFTNQNSWIMVSKMDSVGNVKWTKYFGGDKSYYAYQIVATKDSGCVVIANYYDDQKGTGNETDVYVLKLGPDGNLTTGLNEMELSSSNFMVYPNPGSQIFNIKSNFDVPAKIEFFNALGDKVAEHIMTTNYETIDMSPYAAGLYSYKITANKGKIAFGKWLKL